MKKLTVGLAVLLSGYAANSLAALPTGTSRCDVCVPSYCGGFTFGLTGLYWRASAPHLDYALSYPSFADDSFLFTNGHYHSIDNDYDWGWKANIGYVFPCSGNDVNLTYTHWDNDETDHVANRDFAFLFPTLTSAFSDGFIAPFGVVTFTGTATIAGVAGGTFTAPTPILIPFSPADVVSVSARSEFRNETWDLDFGQTINVGCNFKLRWFGGLRYTRLEHDLDVTHDFAVTETALALDPVLIAVTLTTTTGTALVAPALIAPVVDVAATLRDIVHQKSDFDGIGPRFGFDASYHLGGGFGVVGSLSTSLLVGEHEATFSERILTGGTITVVDATLTTIAIGDAEPGALPVSGELVTGPIGPVVLGPTFPDETFSFKHPDETRVVPNIDAKLGLDWTYQFCNCSRSKVTIEAGYMVSHYFNAIDRLSAVGAFTPDTRSRHTIDASFDGPYVGVQVNL